jgi:DNA-binding LacI/PurR family transcriptional regulator
MPIGEGGHGLGAGLVGADGIADGLFCLNDHIGFGVIDAARRSRRMVAGRDFSVVGFDDVPMAAWEAYRPTTFRQDPQAYAAQVLACLAQRLKEPERQSVTSLLPVDLVERESIVTDN